MAGVVFCFGDGYIVRSYRASGTCSTVASVDAFHDPFVFLGHILCDLGGSVCI